jgi:hypothetical protein
MPANTAKVDRSTKWGNPYKVTPQLLAIHKGDAVSATKSCIASFVDFLHDSDEGRKLIREARRELRGKNLACWCRIGSPCHADEWLTIANQ